MKRHTGSNWKYSPCCSHPMSNTYFPGPEGYTITITRNKRSLCERNVSVLIYLRLKLIQNTLKQWFCLGFTNFKVNQVYLFCCLDYTVSCILLLNSNGFSLLSALNLNRSTNHLLQPTSSEPQMQRVTYIIIDKVALISVVWMDQLPGGLHLSHDPRAHVLRPSFVMCVCTLLMSKRETQRCSRYLIGMFCHSFLAELKTL